MYVDRLAAVAATTASNLQELSTGMSKVASAAASLGVGEDQLAAQLSTIISVTRQAPQTVGTALKTVYARITDIKAGVEEDGTTLGIYSGKLAEMGINVLDTAGNLRNMGTVIEEVGNKWANFSREQQIYIAQTMAGQRQYSNLISLFDNFDKYNDAMQVAGNAAGTLQKQQNVYMDSVEAHMNQLTASTEKMWKSMIDSESMKKLLDFLSGLTNSVGWLIDSLGGGGNVLLTLGNIATTVFQKQMAQSLSKTIYNFNQAREVALSYRSSLASINTQIAQLKDPFGADAGERETLERRKKIIQLSKMGNAIPQQQIQNLNRINDQLAETEALLKAANQVAENAGKNLSKFDFSAGQAPDKLLEQYLDSVNGKDSTGYAAQVNAAIEEQKDLYTQASEKLQENLEYLDTLLSEGAGGITQKAEEWVKAFKDEKAAIQQALKTETDPEQIKFANAQLKELQALITSLQNKTGKTISQTGINIIRNFSQIKTSFKEVDDLIASGHIKDVFNEKQIKNIENFKGKINELENAISKGNMGQPAMKKALQEIINMVPQVQAVLKQGGINLDGIFDSLNQGKQGSNVLDKIKEQKERLLQEFQFNFSKTDFATLANQITGITSGLVQALTVSQQIKNLGGIWGKESISGGEKVLKTVTTVLTAMTTLLPQIGKNVQQLQLYRLARNQAKAATQGETAATNADTGAKILNKAATDAAKTSALSFMALLGPIISLVSIAVGVIGGIISAINQATEEQKKAITERNKQAIELNEKLIEEAKNYNKLSQSLDELNKKYKEGTVSRAEVESQIDELCQQYNLEETQVEKLILKYNNLEDAIRRVKEIGAGKLMQGSKAAANIARDELLGHQTKEKINFDNGNNYGRFFSSEGLSGQEIAYIEKNFGGKFDYKNGLISFEANSDNIYDLAKFQQNMVNMQEYLAGRSRLNTDAYKDVKALNDHAQKHGQESLINAAKEQINGVFQSAILSMDFDESSNLSTFSQKIKTVTEEIKKNNKDLISAWEKQGLDVNEQIRTNILKAIKTENPEIYSQYAAKEASFSRVTENLTESRKQEAQERYSNLSVSAIEFIESLNYSLDDIIKHYDTLIQLKDTFEQTKSVEQLATAYQNLDTVIGKIRKGQKISKDEYQNQKNILGEDIVKKFYDVDASGKNYIFTGDQADFQRLYRDAIATNEEKKVQQNLKKVDALSNVKEVAYNEQLGARINNFTQKDKFDALKDQALKAPLSLKTKNAFDEFGDSAVENRAYALHQAQTLSLNVADFINSLTPEEQDIFYDSEKNPAFLNFQDRIRNAYSTEEWGTINPDADLKELKDDYYKIINDFAEQYETFSKTFLTDEQKEDILAGLGNVTSFQWYGKQITGIDQRNAIINHLKKNPNDEKAWREAQLAYSDIEPQQLTKAWQSTELDTAKKQAEQAGRRLHASLFGQHDSDIDETKLATLTQTIKKAATTTEELADGLKDNFYWSNRLADSILRFDNGLEDSAKNLLALQSQLEDGSLTSLAPAQDIYQDIFGLNSQFSDAFLRNNLSLIHTIVFGTFDEAQSAYNELQKKIADTIFSTTKTDQQKTIADIESSLSSLHIGTAVDIETLEPILEILNKEGLTPAQIKDFFASKFNLEVTVNGKERGEVTLADAFIGADFITKWNNVSTATSDAISNAKKRINYQTQLTKLLDKEVDIYHDINIELSLIDKKLSRLQKIQKNLSGRELLNNLQEQTKVLAEQNKKLKEKQQLQRQDLVNQSSILRGLGATFNQDGSIANYSSLYGSAINNVNSVIQQIRALEKQKYGMYTESTEYKQIEEQINKLKQEQNERQDHLDKVEKYINKYDSTRSSLFDLVDKIEDSARAAIELNLQIFQAKVKIKLDLTQAQRDWDHFVSETLNRDDILNPNSFKSRQKTVELAFKDIKYFDEDYKNLSEQLSRYQEELERFQQARKNGTTYKSELFNSESEALAAAEQTSKQLQEAAKSYVDSMDTIKQAILDAYEDVSEIFSKNNDIYSFIRNQLNHDIQLVDLLEGGRGGRLKDSLYAQISQNDTQNLKQLQAQADYWANEYAKATDEATRQLTKQKWKQTIESINSATEEGIQNLKSKYENLIDTISKQMQNKLTNGFGFNYFTTEWERVKERANSYLDPVNAAFAIKDTEFNYQKAINDTSGLLTQQKLKKVMDQQLNILKQKDKLTQYDVDRANKVLEIEKAKIALEEARNNKTTLRLKRDSQGNYSYQFTANQQAIEDAQNKLDKAKNDLYNLDLKAYQDNADKVIKLTQDTQQKIDEIMKDQNLTQEQRQQRLFQLRQWYQEQSIFLTGQNTSIRNNLMQSAADAMSDSFNQGKIDFESMIGGWNSNTQKWINELAKNPDSAFETMKQGIKEMEQASKQFKDKSNEYLEIAGDGYKTLKETGIDPLVEKEKEAVDNVNSLIDKITEITNTAQTWKSGLDTVASGFDAIKTSANEAGSAILEYKKALAGNGQEDNKGNDTGGTQYGNSVSSGSSWLSSNFVDKTATPPDKTDTPPDKTDTTPVAMAFSKSVNLGGIHNYDALLNAGQSSKEALRQIILNKKSPSQKAAEYEDSDILQSQIEFLQRVTPILNKIQHSKKDTSGKYSKDTFKKAFPDDFEYYYNLYSVAWDNVRDNVKNVLSPIRVLSPLSPLLSSSPLALTAKILGMTFDTGGYTGSWNSTQGKLAILHEKELVLNKDDTQNMLKMLKITRDNQSQLTDYSSIFNTIANNLMTIVKEITLTKMQNDFNNIIESQSNMLKYKTQINDITHGIDQQVKIEANFPNVNSKEQIEAAFSDLVNLAAQRAMRINKN